MSVSLVSILQSKRQNYVIKKNNALSQISRYESAYESLNGFKPKVSRSQEEFHAVNSSKKSILAEVKKVKSNSLTAQKYYSGMKNIFSGIGSKVIGVVYTVLLASISAKLKNYASKINDYEDDVALYNRKITEIDKQIKEAKEAEEAAKLALGGGL